MKSSSQSQSQSRWFLSRVTTLSNPKVIENIRELLSPTQLKLFRTTCFGYLLDLQRIEFHAQVIHSLLLKLVDESDPDQLQLRIGNQILTFGPREFTLITGLKYGNGNESLETEGIGANRLRSAFFENCKRITLLTLESVIDACKVDKREEVSAERDMDIVMLCLIYVVECFLMGKERKAVVDSRWLNLVENLDVFNKWPWGKLSYDRLMTNIHKVISQTHAKAQSKEQEGSKPHLGHYTLYGWPLALQVWAYEAIPSIGAKFAMKSSQALPRILRWATVTTPTIYQLEFVRKKEVIVIQHACY